MKRSSIVALALGLAACSSTAIVSTWKDPSATNLSFRRVAVIALATDPALRRMAENELAKQFKYAEAVASHSFLADQELSNDEAIRTKLRQSGFDGAVVMRVAAVEEKQTWVPGTTAGPYYAFGGWPTYDPGHVRVDTYVRVETNVYSVADDRLVWAAVSRTENPKSVEKLIDKTAEAIARELRKQGLVRG